MRRLWIPVVAAMMVPAAACSSSGQASSSTTTTSPAAETTIEPTTTSSAPTEPSTGTSAAGEPTTTTPTTSAPGPTKEAYVARATAVCADMNAKTSEVGARYESLPRTPQNASALLRENADIIDSAVAELRDIPRPPADVATLESAYDAAAQITPAARAVADALDRGDLDEAKRLSLTADQLTRTANRAIDAYGLIECGSGSSSAEA